MRRRFALVFNARAGVPRPKLLKGVLHILGREGLEVLPVVATDAADATHQVRAIALAAETDCVIAAGGDGTIRAVAAGVAGTSLPVGIIPLGTGNVMRYEIGLAARAEAIAETLLNGQELEFRGGTVNGAPFFLMVGVGFDARIVEALNQKTKRLLGRAAYAVPVLKTLAAGPDRLDVEIDGAKHSASWVIVSNASRYGGSFTLTRDTRLGADGLVAVLVKGTTRLSLLRASTALGLGWLPDARRRPKDVLALPARQVRINSSYPVPVEVDGDEGGATPVEILAGGPCVRLIVPPAYVADLTNRHTNHVTSFQ